MQPTNAQESSYARALVALSEPLHQLALDSIRHGLNHGIPISVDESTWPELLQQAGACFVTLEINGKLRGCIGSIEPYRALVLDISENAFAAAFRDFRFDPLNQQEFEQLKLSISVLTPLKKIRFDSCSKLESLLVPNCDGLVLQDQQGHRAVFLPQVWESLPKPSEFLKQLKLKGQIPLQLEPPELMAFQFTVIKL